MGKSEMFKKFLCQKTVLDTLRVYLDITDTFLQDLMHNGLIDKDEMHLLKTLGWPSIRNQLMQILIKRNWKKDEFTVFVNILDKSQDPELVKTINIKAEDYFKDSGITFGPEHEIVIDPQVTMLDDLLMGVSVRDSNKIRSLLKEKDDYIKKLEEGEVNLKSEIHDLNADNSDLHLRLHSLEQAADTLIKEAHLEQEPEAYEQGLVMVGQELHKKQVVINDYIEKLQTKTQQYQHQKEWTSELTTEVIELKKIREQLEKELKAMNEKYHGETFILSTKVEELEAVNVKLENRLATEERHYIAEIADRDDEIDHLKREISVSDKMKVTAESAKEDMEERFASLQNKVRKLLESLGLENECKNFDLAVDFARDVAMAKRRTSRIASFSTKAVLNPIAKVDKTEEQLYEKVDLPWGNTPQDIQRRRDSVSIEAMFPVSSSISIQFDGNAAASSSTFAAQGQFSSRKKLPPVGES